MKASSIRHHALVCLTPDSTETTDGNNPLALQEPNERQVAPLLAQGMTNEQIAQRGFLSYSV